MIRFAPVHCLTMFCFSFLSISCYFFYLFFFFLILSFILVIQLKIFRYLHRQMYHAICLILYSSVSYLFFSPYFELSFFLVIFPSLSSSFRKYVNTVFTVFLSFCLVIFFYYLPHEVRSITTFPFFRHSPCLFIFFLILYLSPPFPFDNLAYPIICLTPAFYLSFFLTICQSI